MRRAFLQLRRLLPAETAERILDLDFVDAGHGHDKFGMSPEWVAAAVGLLAPLYDRWFRVSSYGIENIPAEGAAVLAANHSGTIPLDAMMICCDVVRRTDPARGPRTVMDHFVNMMPFVSVLFSRAGAVGGSRANFHELLEGGELVLVFPEGVPGVGKRFRDRYQLQDWRVGHVEMAIRHGVPVVPIGVVGAEEQLPQIARLPISAFGAPYLPVTAVPLPLPVHYHIHYGAPVPVHERWRPEQSSDPEVLREAAAAVKAEVRALLDRGLALREGIFR